MENIDFMGLNNFVWWFGVVENRLDPINLGRVQVRCFGWHTDDRNQIPIEDLPWAHPVVPYGSVSVKPPSEGTMVFGFFADGREGRFPVILGTVPGIPEEIRASEQGFTDPISEADKATQSWPRKIKEVLLRINGEGVDIQDDIARRNPTYLNEPTVSRLARPTRATDANGQFLGIVPGSIANTTIAIQRNNRVANVVSASDQIWNEPFPSYSAMYPFNHVDETESGHAFEMDDTPGYERVQLSHRTGSTIEFMSEGDVKQKNMRNKYDVTMANDYKYTAGKRDEVVQSDMFLKINGKLIIQCENVDFVAKNNVNIKGNTVNITGVDSLNLASKGNTKIGGLNTHVSGEASARLYGGYETTMSSSGTIKTTAPATSIDGAMVELNGAILNTRFNLHQFLSMTPSVVPSGGAPDRPSLVRAPLPKTVRTNPSNKKPKTEKFGGVVNDPNSTKPITQITGRTIELPAAVTTATVATEVDGDKVANTTTQQVAIQNGRPVQNVNSTSTTIPANEGTLDKPNI